MKVTGTCLSLNTPRATPPPGQWTCVLFGVRRGGTTAVARITQELGVFIGSDLGNNLEDGNFRKPRGLHKMRDAIKQRNRDFPRWGWKHPQPYNYLPDLLPDLRNPRFIFVTRDIGANALGIATREDLSHDAAMISALGQQRRGWAMARDHNIPTLIVSYEKLILHPQRVISDLADFYGIGVTQDKTQAIARLIVPGRYHQMARTLSFRQKVRETLRIWI